MFSKNLFTLKRMIHSNALKWLLVPVFLFCLIEGAFAEVRVVTSTNVGALKVPIHYANDGDEVRFNVNGPVAAGYIYNNRHYVIQTNNDIKIIGPATIDGSAIEVMLLKITGSANNRTDVIIEDITFQNGFGVTYRDLNDSTGTHAPGGAIHVGPYAKVTFRNCHFIDNRSILTAGAVYNEQGSEVRFENCTFSGNEAMDPMNGIGGAIYNSGKMSVIDCQFGVLSPNKAYLEGGAIANYCQSNERLDIIRSAFSYNQSATGKGGGVYNAFGSRVYCYETTFAGNSAAEGGGLYSLGTAGINQSTFHDNQSSGAGGGIYGRENSFTYIDNSTFSANIATNTGGGIFNLGLLALNSCTFTLNHADLTGGGLHNASTGDVVILNTLIAQNTSNGANPDVSSMLPATMTSEGYNLVGILGSANLGPLASDITGTVAQPIDAKLGILTDNGGETSTHALLSDSPALCSGGGVAAKIPSEDQRGEVRIAEYSIGAFESPACKDAVGIDPELAGEIKLYPNPVTHESVLELDLASTQKITISLLDLNGKIIRQEKKNLLVRINKISLENWISNLTSGLYILQITDDHGAQKSFKIEKR
jgi:hypothetical protein